MLTFVFEFDNPIKPGQYLLGSPRWSKAVGIITARLVCQAGSSTDLTVFQFEVDGVLIDKKIPVLPQYAGQLINLPVPVRLPIAANSELRVKCISGPTVPEEAIRRIGLNLSADDVSTAAAPTFEMWVRWSRKGEKLRLFEYNPSTHLFTESSVGISAGRATIDNASTFLATIFGVTAAQSDATQTLQANEIICNGGTAANENPRLEFIIGQTRVATLTASGVLYVLDISESATVTAGTDRFTLYGNGIVAATIGPGVDGTPILTAIECREPTS